MNPLQYVPVVGTIYRAVTGDTIPEGIRMAGSLVVGTLLSGPIGLVTGIATIIAEKATGIDPERIARNLFNGPERQNEQPRQPVDPKEPPSSPAVATTSDPPLSETERLNARELARILAANAAYAQAARLT